MSYNRAYHRHFEGYVEQETCDPATGRKRIQRLYVGPYYRHKLTDKAWKKLKAAYVLLFFWSAACLVVQGFSSSTNVWYLVVPLALGLLAVVWVGFSVVSYALNGRELEIRQYRDRELLKASAMAGVLCFGLLAAGQTAWMILRREVFPYAILCTALDAAAAAGLYLLYRTERDMAYTKRDNGTQAPPDSYDIRYRENEE